VSERDPFPWPDDDALASEPELDPETERALAEALRSAWEPAPLDPRRQEELLEQAFTDPFAPATDDELRESERLRQALDAGDESHPDVRLLRALRAAKVPASLSPETAEAARSRAGRRTRGSGANVLFVSFGAAALAAAAAFALVIGGGFHAEPAPRAARLLPSRSTSELFERQFEQGETTERIDRIASARAHDLRENRYRRWGAR
jgi:hypothetical protein